MDPSTMYLTAFTIIGGIIFLVLFFHYVPFFLWLSKFQESTYHWFNCF